MTLKIILNSIDGPYNNNSAKKPKCLPDYDTFNILLDDIFL